MSGLLDRARGLFALRLRKDFNFRRAQETVPALRWLKPRKGERILDIGCGEGTYDYRVALRGARVFGFDLDRNQLRRAQTTTRRPSRASSAPMRTRSPCARGSSTRS